MVINPIGLKKNYSRKDSKNNILEVEVSKKDNAINKISEKYGLVGNSSKDPSYSRDQEKGYKDFSQSDIIPRDLKQASCDLGTSKNSLGKMEQTGKVFLETMVSDGNSNTNSHLDGYSSDSFISAAKTGDWSQFLLILENAKKTDQILDLTVSPKDEPNQGLHVLWWAIAHKQWVLATSLLDYAKATHQILDLTVSQKDVRNPGLHVLWGAISRWQWALATSLLDYAKANRQTLDLTVSLKDGPHQGLHVLWGAIARGQWALATSLLEYAKDTGQTLDLTVSPKDGKDQGLHVLWVAIDNKQWALATSLLYLSVDKISQDFFEQNKSFLKEIKIENEGEKNHFEFFCLNFLMVSNPKKIEEDSSLLNSIDTLQNGLEKTFSEIVVFNENSIFPNEIKEIISIDILIGNHPVLKPFVGKYNLFWIDFINQRFREHLIEQDVLQKRALSLGLKSTFIKINSFNEEKLGQVSYSIGKDFVFSVVSSVQKEIINSGFMGIGIFNRSIHEKIVGYMNKKPLERSSQGPFFTFNQQAIEGMLYRGLEGEMIEDDLKNISSPKKQEIIKNRNKLNKKFIVEFLIEIFRKKHSALKGEILNEQDVPEIRKELMEMLDQVEEELQKLVFTDVNEGGHMKEQVFFTAERRKEINRRCSGLSKEQFITDNLKHEILSVYIKGNEKH